jgi:hypothetical protein
MEYNDNPDNQENEMTAPPIKHPGGLTVLCVLTFIGSGFSFLMYFICFCFYDSFLDTMQTMGSMSGTLGTLYNQSAEQFKNTPTHFFLFMMLPPLVTLLGAGYMLKLRKVGFHLYVIGQILLLSLPVLIAKDKFNMLGLFFSIVFVSLYSLYIKRME